VIVSHAFASAGTFNVVLTVSDTAGQIDTETKPVTVVDASNGAPCTNCARFTGTLPEHGVQFQPDGTFYRTHQAGTQRGWLRGPADANFNLALLRWNGRAWHVVAASNGPNATEQITFTGPAGFYVWRVHAVQGQGAYEFFLQTPTAAVTSRRDR
jgi:PKD repeat protein